MNLALQIARRYLFSKKSHNAINVISAISASSIMVATAALICALSVFNGFTSVAEKMFSAFDPDLKITSTYGKVFKKSDIEYDQIKSLSDVALVSESLEENALLKFSDRQRIILFKGVSPQFKDLANIESLLYDGQFELRGDVIDHGVLGAGLAYHLGITPGFLTPLELYVPKRDVKVNLMNPSTAFNQKKVYLAGSFSINKEEYDEQMFIISIDLARELLNYTDEVTSIDLKVKNGAWVSDVKQEVQAIVGDEYEVKDKFEQQADMYKMVNIEKWVTFFIIVIISAIAVFNIVGSLSMLIIEKKEDIRILRSMGASKKLVEKIFLFEGWLIVLSGAVLGLLLGLLICFMQQEFGILKLGSSEDFLVEDFPVSVQMFDVFATFMTISIVGFIAVLYPILNLRKGLKE